jgi:protein SCO1/2
MKKFFFLLLTLAIPVAIFLFLKIFGSNSFDVPVLFENGIPDCNTSISPHKVPDIENIGDSGKNYAAGRIGDFVVFGVLDASIANERKIIELVRIQDAFYEVGAPFFVLLLKGDRTEKESLEQRLEKTGMERQNFAIVVTSPEELVEFLRCGLALKGDASADLDKLVLVDPTKNIRGIYQSTDQVQTDELILELKILKQKV